MVDFTLTANDQPIAIISVGDTTSVRAVDKDVRYAILRQLTTRQLYRSSNELDGGVEDGYIVGRAVHDPEMMQLVLLDLPMKLSTLYPGYKLKVDGDWNNLIDQDETEDKHLAGRHDQQSHAGDEAADVAKLASRWYNGYKSFPRDQLAKLGEKYPYQGVAYRGLRLQHPNEDYMMAYSDGEEQEAKLLASRTPEENKNLKRLWELEHILGDYEALRDQAPDTSDADFDAEYSAHWGGLPTAEERQEWDTLQKWYVERALKDSTGIGSSWSKTLGGMKYYQDLSGWDLQGEEMAWEGPFDLVIKTTLDYAVDLEAAFDAGIDDPTHGDAAHMIAHAKEVVSLAPVEHYEVIRSPAGRYRKSLVGQDD